MAIIKCKMCGGDLNIVEGSTVAECEYCGTKQTVPSADNEKKLTLFGRAGRLLRACEFDKAAGVYESIVAEFPEEAEAYWGLVLCKYGIEYVDDPATGKKIPTCHRSSFESVMDDENFDQACENADAVARRLYREEAKAIEELRKRIIEVSGKEAPYDIFICYKETDENGDRTLDSVLAQDIYDALTEKGYRVFFSRVTLEDKLGQEYEPYIFAALNSAKVMLAVGTDYDYYNAVWVKNEWSRFLQLIASGQKKTLIPCYKNIDAYDMPKEFAKLQAQDLGKVGAMQDLLRGVDKLLGKGQQAAPVQAIVQQMSGGPNVDSLCKRGQIFLSDGEWAKADEYFDKALDINPECAQAYFGKLLSAREAKSSKMLAEQAGGIAENPLFQNAMRYADEALAAELNAVLEGQKKLATGIKHARLAGKHIAIGSTFTVGLKSDGTIVSVGDKNFKHTNDLKWSNIIAISANEWGMEGIKSDGTVVSIGNYYQSNKSGIAAWTNIVSVVSSELITVGIKINGTVVAAGNNLYGRCNVSDWTNIVAVAIGNKHTVGLKSNGRVVAVGNNDDGQCDVSSWTNIISIYVHENITIGLKADGTVVATGRNDFGQCNVSNWTDIIAVTASNTATVGLKSNCTVVSTGELQDKLTGWTGIISIASGDEFIVGLKSDGTVVAVGRNDKDQCSVGSWSDVVAIAAYKSWTMGVKSDGTVVATGPNDEGQCNVSNWKLFNSIDTLEAEEIHNRKEQIVAFKHELEKEASSLRTELSNLRGLFSGMRRKQIELRLAEIEGELNKLK